MTELVAWVNGTLVPSDRATISAYDVGFRSGEGVFETLRAYGDHPFRLETHLDRAIAGARTIGFTPVRAQLRSAVHAVITGNLPAFGGADSAVRLTVSAGAIDPASAFPGLVVGGPTIVATSHPLAPSADPSRATAVSVPVVRALPEVKATSYLTALTARREASDRGADEALLVDAEGHVREGAMSNVFAVADGILITPPIDAGLLAGVTRGVVLEIADQLGIAVREERLPLAVLTRADEAFLTASTRGLIPLVTLDGAQVGADAPGALTRRLIDGYREAVETERRAARPDRSG